MKPKKYSDKDLYALILAGGVGSRFWPFSRELEPKQFMKIAKDASILQETIARLKGLVSHQNIYIISNAAYFFELKEQVKTFNIPEENIVLEPTGKNTAPAIGLCSRLIERINKDAILLVLPSDHSIRGLGKFKACIQKAKICAKNNFLVTIGIKPRKAATGYGYIKIGSPLKVNGLGKGFYKVERFLEKPSLAKAEQYVTNKDYFWNSGMFIWKVSVFLDELTRCLPRLYSKLKLIKAKGDIVKVWKSIKPISVDYGIMEHSKKIALIGSNFRWTDLGSWDALGEVLPKDSKGNIIQADSLDLKSKGIYVFSRSNRLIATIGLKDLIIADTPDALLISYRYKAQEVKKIVDRLKLSKRRECLMHTTDRRPWGSYTVLQSARGFKVKLLEIDPGKRLSLQKHNRRAEHWVVVSGVAKVRSGNTVKLLKSNQGIYIPKGAKHRIENPGSLPLKIVEVQTGSYLEEDDIERFEDDFNRGKSN